MNPSDFQHYLDVYAEIIVKIGLNLQPGQRLLIGAFGSKSRGAPLETAPLVRAVAAQAYRAGARFVDVIWRDDEFIRTRFTHAEPDSFTEFPGWKADVTAHYMRAGDAIFAVSAYDPYLLDGVDPQIAAVDQRVAIEHARPIVQLIAHNATNWNGASAPIPGWSAAVLPDVPEAERELAMWELIFRMCRVLQDDPVGAWRAHIDGLLDRAAYLNDRRYTGLHYRAPGTDLRVGLPEGHIWRSGGLTSQSGIFFTANIPTEEVFTLPHKDQVEGVVRSTKPLSVAGTVIEDFELTFEQGRIVEATAEKGQQQLQNLIGLDDGASRIGEVALVPHSSPISQSGRLFYNILYDENASCHIALGNAYRFTMQDAEQMSDEQFEAAGGNQSMIHVDFMMGSGAIDIDGITASGEREPLMRGGEWAFTV